MSPHSRSMSQKLCGAVQWFSLAHLNLMNQYRTKKTKKQKSSM